MAETVERPSAAPELPGFTPLSPIGRGGFAEVHLYQQARPRRQVAVKILSTALRGDSTIEAFESEANLLASVSAHPAIVTIHGADVSPDGRPFIVMEHCPRPNLQQRIRRGRLSVPEALAVATQLCGAVETAHRAGVLHRDIKPANVLFTQFDRPALADFGIANALTGAVVGPVGLSVPWSPVEAFDGAHADARLDVYALGATLYTMLAGRAPYHVPGGDNGHEAQMGRIRRALLPPIDREDLPSALVRVMERALSRDREDRQRSAIALGRDLQRVQAELALDQTAMDVFDEVEEASEHDDETRTHVRRAPTDDAALPVRVDGALPVDAEQQTVVRGAVEAPRPAVDEAARRSPERGDGTGGPARGWPVPALVMIGVGLVAAAAGTVLLLTP